MSDEFEFAIWQPLAAELPRVKTRLRIGPTVSDYFADTSWLLPSGRPFQFSPLRCGLAGARLPLGSDAFKQLRRRFVIRILRYKLAGEGVAQDRLPQSALT
ncbi:MAG: hypothetical protein A2W68_03615 [Betaproteobacteria bacterium RIFCSPLOWO2_02_64_14]|nr:MAG: hypothetical protein A2W68_03615 [Betaproteobacteria bacterium RIFCSPLOWO2_02_64_14]